MMRKFPKLLAVVLAIAIIICPAMCLTSMAEESTPANDYSVAYENNVVTVTVSANEGFLVALLRLDVTGFSVDEEAITVAATPLGLDDPGTVVANPDFNAETGVLSLLIASNEAANTALMADATVSIPVTKTATDDNYRISLTTLQAADAGTIDEETGVVTAPEALLTFTNVNTETGEIDVEAAAGKNVAVAPCAHSNTTPDSKEATCTEAGYNRVTCNDCGEVITDEVIEPTGHDFEYEDLGDGTHMRVCANCAEDATEAHIDDDADLLCDSCNASLETEEPECQHETNTTDNVNFVEFTAEGIVHYENCTICGEKVVTSTDTSADAITVADKALDQAYVSAINVTAAGTYDIPVTQNTGLQVAYVDGDKIYANAYNANHNDDDISNGENAINLAGTSPYNEGALTGITDTVNVTVDFTGIIMAFVPANASKLPTATIGMSSAYDLGSSIGMLFKVNKTNLTNFESVYALIDHEAYSGNTLDPKYDQLFTEYKLDGNYYTFTYNIMASQMGDDVTCTFYGTLDGVEYTLRQKYNFSFVAYAISNVGYAGSDAEFKTLLSTMLKYGAVAQNSFLYRTNELVTDNDLIVNGNYLTLYPAAETVAKDAIEQVESKTNYFNEDGSTPATADRLCGVTKGLNCESTVEIYYAMNLTKFLSNRPDADINDIKFTVYYKEPSKTLAEVDFTTEEFTIADAYKVEGNTYYFKADKIVASMMASESKITAQLGDYVFCESLFSVNAYNVTNYDSTTDVKTGSISKLGELCKAIATYGVTARAYFDIISK